MKSLLLLRYNEEPLHLNSEDIAAVFPHSAGLIEVKYYDENGTYCSEIGHTLIQEKRVLSFHINSKMRQEISSNLMVDIVDEEPHLTQDDCFPTPYNLAMKEIPTATGVTYLTGVYLFTTNGEQRFVHSPQIAPYYSTDTIESYMRRIAATLNYMQLNNTIVKGYKK